MIEQDSGDVARRVGVQVGGGFVEDEDGRVRQERPSQCQSGPLTPETSAWPSPTRVWMPAGREATHGPRAAAVKAAETSASVASGRANRTFSTIDEAKT